MSLRECIDSHTHREYLAWIRWLKDEKNVPNRSDGYLMQIAAEVRNVLHSLGKNTQRINLEDFKLTFKESKPKPELSREEESDKTKRRWFGVLSRTTKKDG